MVKYYWAVMLDVTDKNDLVTYGYAFRANNMREAKLHAISECKELGVIPLPSVWRVSLEKYNWMKDKYCVPKPLDRVGAYVDGLEHAVA